jgi:putative RecB family exonuclease
LKKVDEPNMLSLTPSKVREYLTCPRQYSLKSIAGMRGSSASPALSFGSSIHAALEEMHRDNLPADPSADYQEILHRHWRASDYRDMRESDLYFSRGHEALSRYVGVVGQTTGEILGTELYLSRVVRLGDLRVRLGCKVDRLERRQGGALEALDYKTNAGGRVPTREFLANDLATFVYYVLVRLSYPECACVIVSQLNVLTLAKVEVDYDSAKLAAHKQALTELARAISSGAFDPRPGVACSWCSVRDHCPVPGADADLDGFF